MTISKEILKKMKLSEIVKFVKETKAKEKEKKRLLTTVWDVQTFQDMIRQVNKNPNLKAILRYPDGRSIELANLVIDYKKKPNLYSLSNETIEVL